MLGEYVAAGAENDTKTLLEYPALQLRPADLERLAARNDVAGGSPV